MDSTIVVERHHLRRELARHQQIVTPTALGLTAPEARCSCGDWVGTFVQSDDEASFAEHLLQVIEGFSYTPFANPDCVTCEGAGVFKMNEPCPDCIVGVWA